MGLEEIVEGVEYSITEGDTALKELDACLTSIRAGVDEELADAEIGKDLGIDCQPLVEVKRRQRTIQEAFSVIAQELAASRSKLEDADLESLEDFGGAVACAVRDVLQTVG